jgi:hypothetical protein
MSIGLVLVSGVRDLGLGRRKAKYTVGLSRCHAYLEVVLRSLFVL